MARHGCFDDADRPQTRPHLISREIAGEFVVVDPDAERTYLLSGASAQAWRALTSGPGAGRDTSGLGDALTGLDAAGLLANTGQSRRDLLKRSGAALAAVGIASVALPDLAWAGSQFGPTTAYGPAQSGTTIVVLPGQTAQFTVCGGGGGGAGNDPSDVGAAGGKSARISYAFTAPSGAGSVTLTLIVGGGGGAGLNSTGAGAGDNLGGAAGTSQFAAGGAGTVGTDGDNSGGGGGGASAVLQGASAILVSGAGGGAYLDITGGSASATFVSRSNEPMAGVDAGGGGAGDQADGYTAGESYVQSGLTGCTALGDNPGQGGAGSPAGSSVEPEPGGDGVIYVALSTD